jgi:hypothetical protein
MRTIIAGSREFYSYKYFLEVMNKIPWKPTVILSGHAYGVDRMGEQWANENNIPLEVYPAEWDKYGKRAGYLRNAQMAEKAEALVAVWDGKSKGTKIMIDIAKRKNLNTYVDIMPHQIVKILEMQGKI